MNRSNKVGNSSATLVAQATWRRCAPLRSAPLGHATPPLVLGVSLLLLSGCATSQPVPQYELRQEPWQFGRDQGHLMVTDHFELFTTIKDEGLRQALPLFVESAYAVYSDLIPPKPAKEERLRTYLFHSRYQWDQFTRMEYPERYNTYRMIRDGGFSIGRVAVMYYLDRAYTLSILAHEGMHQYIANNIDITIPAWLNEGLACYCESFDLQGDRPIFTPRRNIFRLNSLRRTLTADGLIPLRELLDTHAGHVVSASRKDLTAAYYAQVWAFVVFLRHGPSEENAQAFERLMRDVHDGSVYSEVQRQRRLRGDSPQAGLGRAVFDAYFSVDLDEIEQQYRDFMIELADLGG